MNLLEAHREVAQAYRNLAETKELLVQGVAHSSTVTVAEANLYRALGDLHEQEAKLLPLGDARDAR
jgi:hypothetical protein